MHIRARLFVSALVLLMQVFFAEVGAHENLFKPGWYGCPNDAASKAVEDEIFATEAWADLELSFAGPEEVQICGRGKNEGRAWTQNSDYVKPDKMLELLKEHKSKDLLVIHLEKRFDYWMKPEKQKEAKNKVIEFAKKTGFRRCLIVMASAMAVGVLTDFYNDKEGAGDSTSSDAK